MAAEDGKRKTADEGAAEERIHEVDGTTDGEKPTLQSTIFYFFLPLIIAALWIAGLLLLMPLDQSGYIVAGMTAYSFTPAGPEIVVPLVTRQVMENGGDTFMHPAIVATSLAFVDMVFAMFFMWNFDLLLKIPLIGPWMAKMERIGKRKLSDRPWVHRFALLGLILYTMFPFQGSGGAVGSIFGRILGMGKRRVFAAITVGAFAGAFPFAYLTYYGVDAADRFLTDEQKIIGGAVFFIIIIAAMIHLSREEDRLYGDEVERKEREGKKKEGKEEEGKEKEGKEKEGKEKEGKEKEGKAKRGTKKKAKKERAGKDRKNGPAGKGRASSSREGKTKRRKKDTGGRGKGDSGTGEAPTRND